MQLLNQYQTVHTCSLMGHERFNFKTLPRLDIVSRNLHVLARLLSGQGMHSLHKPEDIFFVPT